MHTKTAKWSALILFLTLLCGSSAWGSGVSSSNIPLDSSVYQYIDKLAGMGLISSAVKGLKPFSRSEAARLTHEAETALEGRSDSAPELARSLIERLKELIPREYALYTAPETAPRFGINPLVSSRLRYVWLQGRPRDYNRTSLDPGHQSAFGFIGGDLRPVDPGEVHTTGTEGTPLLENNNGTIHPTGHSFELRSATEGYLTRYATLFVEPKLVVTEQKNELMLEKGYLTIGSGGLALEVGRGENWFGPGSRGTTTLTNNAQNFDQIKLWSPEPINLGWVKEYLGNVKYALLLSRFDKTGQDTSHLPGGSNTTRQPYFVGAKLAVQPSPWWEIGANFVRQMGGPGFAGSPDTLFGGGDNDHSNTIAGFDLRFRIPWLRNIELYGEYSGEDNAGGVWPFVESYVGGIYIPCLTDSCRDEFRFEYFFGSVMLYGDWQFPAGYVYHNMTPGHSQGGGGVQEFYGRYAHWFGVRNQLAAEYFYTERGRSYRMPGQVTESKHAGRLTWSLPVYADIDTQVSYGIESIANLNLVAGVRRTNQLFRFELRYRY